MYYILTKIGILLITIIQCYVLAFLLSSFIDLNIRSFNRYLIIGVIIIVGLLWIESPSLRLINNKQVQDKELKLAIVDRHFSNLSEDVVNNTYNAVDDEVGLIIDPEYTHGDYIYQIATSDNYVKNQVDKDIDLIQVAKRDGHITKATTLRALNYIKDNDFDFVLIPFGVEYHDEQIQVLISEIVNDGTIVIASQGNLENGVYPANYDDVISVSTRKSGAYLNRARVSVVSKKKFIFEEEEHRLNDFQAAYITNLLMNTYSPENKELYKQLINEYNMRLNWLIRLIRN